jgi:polyhydroxybutyrate depolymerase
MRGIRTSIAAVAAVMASIAAAQDCGGVDMPCETPLGSYHVGLPETPEGAPVVLFLHGYASSGAGAAKPGGMFAGFRDRGYAVVAPNGQHFPNQPDNRDWGVRDGYHWPRNDVAFIAQVLDDAAARFGLDRSQVLATGFSRGGSMIWDLACRAPDSATAFAAVSGAFWEPLPAFCLGPVHLHHSHGYADRVVPLEGREAVFAGHRFEMGDVMKSFAVLRDTGGCPKRADADDTEGAYWLKTWTECSNGGSLTLMLTAGGHGIPKGWTNIALDWFEALPGQ